jgi:hypothetical protein
MNKITRDDTEHGVEYVRADEAEAEIESIQDGADADKVIIQYHEATIKRLQAEIDMLKGALKEWSDKTDWVQETAQPLELGMHRADMLKQRIERLNKSLTWEQNRSERIGTHGPGCHTWGPAHYECLLRVNAELVEALKVFCSLGRADSSTDWNVAFNEGAKAIAKATGETK